MDRGDGIFCRISTNVETRFLNQRDIKEKSLLFQFLLGSLPLSLSRSLARSIDETCFDLASFFNISGSEESTRENVHLAVCRGGVTFSAKCFQVRLARTWFRPLS